MLNRVEYKRTTPESQGIASAAIRQFVEALASQIHEPHSIMLLRHGSVVAEGWWSPYGREQPHSLFSVSKSFTSTAVGLAMNEGYFAIDDPVLSFFPDDIPLQVNEHLAVMRVRHLLTMSTGHADDTWSDMENRADGNWIKAFFEVPVRYAPGSHFLYNTGASYMLSAIVQKTTGMKLVDYLETRLFAPLGITSATWEESPQGINSGGIGLNLKTEDIARFGQLYLQNGLWQGQQLLPPAWVSEATAVQMINGTDSAGDWTQGYGYQFWRCRHNAYRGDGVFGQFCIIMPDQDAVLAMTGGLDVFEMQQPLNLVWDLLLPAMQPDALPDDPLAQAALAQILSGLHLPPVSGQAAAPVSAAVSGRTYQVDANALNLTAITLTFSDAGGTVRFKTAAGEESIPWGYGRWQVGHTRLFNPPGVLDLVPVAASGAWSSADSLTMMVRLYTTPFYHTLVYYFDGDTLMIETRVNVSLGSLETLLLTAQAV